MKIVSDITGKVYNTGDPVKDYKLCSKEDKEFLEKQSAIKKAEEEKAENASRVKRELCSKIDKAQEEIDKAYEEYEEAKEKAKVILEESNDAVAKLLNGAKEKVVAAEKAKWDFITDFNSKFGPYKKTFTGKDATKEFERATNGLCQFDNELTELLNMLF